MAVTVKKIVLWRKEIENRTGIFANALAPLANAGGGVPLVVENREGVFSRYPKKTTGSWSESDRGGTRLCEKVYNLVVKGKVFLDRIG